MGDIPAACAGRLIKEWEFTMADCECLGGCPFFNSKMAQSMSAVAKSMKKRFCLGDNSNCARYQVFKALGKPRVPGDLIPNQSERARQIIAAG